jgi:putative transcriptional regulator
MKDSNIGGSRHTANNRGTNPRPKDITLRNIKTLQLPVIQEFTPARMIHIRKKFRLSQAALAKVFNISPSAVRKWEVGDKSPSGASKKLYDLIERKGLEVFI